MKTMSEMVVCKVNREKAEYFGVLAAGVQQIKVVEIFKIPHILVGDQGGDLLISVIDGNKVKTALCISIAIELLASGKANCIVRGMEVKTVLTDASKRLAVLRDTEFPGGGKKIHLIPEGNVRKGI